MRKMLGALSLAAMCLAGFGGIVSQAEPAPAVAGTVAKPDAGTRLILLGTAGGPGARVDRSGIASLVVVDGVPYLIDAGDGVTRQLVRAGFAERDIRNVFLTHLHDDHTVGLPALTSFAYTVAPPSGPSPVTTWIMGPPGTGRLVEGLLSFLAASAEIRMAERPRLAKPAAMIRARELGVGEVYADDRVKVTAIENTHFNLPASEAARNKSYSYRFETKGRSIVFTGDTGPSERLREFARNADVLVAEMITPADVRSVPPQVVRHMLEEHLTATQLGKLAQQAGVKTLVLSHVRSVAKSDLAEIRKVYAGRIIAGRDLLEL